jgi:hypothetical protein
MSKIIAISDEFSYELDDDEYVSIVDGENTVRVTMPLYILRDLSQQVICQMVT